MSYSFFVEETAPILSALMGTVTNQSDIFTVIDNTTVRPKFISGEDATVLTAQIKCDVANSSLIDVISRIYSVIHNCIAYPFMFTENVSRYDLPENMKVKEQFSIK